MDQQFASLEEVIQLAKRFSPQDKVRLIEFLAPSIESDLCESDL